MQIRVQTRSEFLINEPLSPNQDIMTRYIHFGELDKYSLNKVYLEIASHLLHQADQRSTPEVELIKDYSKVTFDKPINEKRYIFDI